MSSDEEVLVVNHGARDEVDTVPLAEAMPLVFPGKASIYQTQDTPPIAFVSALLENTQNFDLVGPPLTTHKIIRTVENQICRDTVRRAMVGENSVTWVNRYADLVELVETCLSACTDYDRNIFSQLRMTLETFQQNNKVTHPLGLTDDELEKNYLVRAPASAGFINLDQANFYQLNQEWFEFRQALETLRSELASMIVQSIKEGRILVVEGGDMGCAVVAPDIATAICHASSNLDYHFMLTQDLPKSIFTSNENMQIIKSKAKRWVERICAHFADENRRPSGADMIDGMIGKLKLSKNAATEVWNSANIPNRGRPGKIPEHERVNFNEFKDI